MTEGVPRHPTPSQTSGAAAGMSFRPASQLLPSWFSAKTVLLAAGLLVLFALTQWNTLNGPFDRDEGEYAYAAWLMREGMVPYRDSFMQKPPMIIYTYLVSQLFADGVFWPPRLLGTVFVALTAVLAGLISAREYGTRSGWFSVWILLPLYALPWLLPFGANTEKFMNLPMMGALALHAFYRRKSTMSVWFFAGILSALALMYKPICLLVLGFLFVDWAFETRKPGLGMSAVLGRFCFAFLGGLSAVALALSYFLWRGALGELWESSIQFNLFYSNISSWSPHAFLRIMSSVLFQWWILWALLIWYVFKRPGRWFFHLSLLLIALFSAYKDPNGHYYLMVLPFWAIIAGAALDSMVQTITSRRWFQSKSLPVTSAVVVVGLLCWPIGHQFSMEPSSLYRWATGPGNPFHESPIVADRVAALTTPDDFVFVAGSEPQILFYSKRKSPTRFVIMYPLMLPTPFAEDYQQETIDSLRANPPKLIVFSNSRFSWLSNPSSPKLLLPYLNNLFQSGAYELMGGYLQKREKSGWEEPFSQQQISEIGRASCRERV